MGASKQTQGRAHTIERPGVPAELARQFAQFRRQHGRGSRVPPELRAAVLRALDQGVGRECLRRALGLGGQQLDTWQRGAAAGAEHGGFARIFEVTDAAEAGEPGGSLELRLGDFSIVIRTTRAE